MFFFFGKQLVKGAQRWWNMVVVDFENNVPTPEQATFGSLARDDINFTADIGNKLKKNKKFMSKVNKLLPKK